MKSVAKVIKSFRNELATIYPLTEINSVIEIVFEETIGFSKTDILLKPDFQLSETAIEKLQKILAQLKNNEPVQYVLGKTVFFDLLFKVTPAVLIPRMETEELVDWIIQETTNEKKDIKILDIGTGSGCIAISLAANLEKSIVSAFDVSEEALALAKKNASLNKVNVRFEKKDILRSQQGVENYKFDCIVSNPPYVLEREKSLMAKNVLDYEPYLALFVKDADALLFYKAIVNYAKLNLNEGGRLYFEINEAYGEELETLMLGEGFKTVELRKDLNGKDRMVRGSK